MNKYSKKILKMVAKHPVTFQELEKSLCPSIAQICIKDLISKNIIQCVNKGHNVETGEVIEIKRYIITLNGLDLLEENRKNSLWYWIPIISTAIISIISLIKSFL